MPEQFETLKNIREIDQEKNDPFENDSEKNQEFSDDLKKYQEEGQKFIDSHRRFFAMFAKDVSLDFKMSNGFFIDLEKGEVNLDTKWFAERNFSKIKILWANLHELSHFRDLSEDPKKMMENFEYIRERAKKTGEIILRKWEEKYKASDPELIENLKKQKPISKKNPQKTMNQVEQSAYKIHHTFYNIFDDIYANEMISRKSPIFGPKKDGEKEVEELYGKTLFPQNDYSKLPFHLQFIYKLIREEMVPDEEVLVSDEMKDVFERKIKFLGKEYSSKEIVEELIKPQKSRDTKAGQRYYVLQKTLEPIFEELLSEDIKKWDPQKPEKKDGESQREDGQGNPANPFDQDYQDYDKNNPDQINDEDVENWMEKDSKDKESEEAKKNKENEEKNKSSEDRAKEMQGDLDSDWCEKNNIDPNMLQKFREIEAEISPYLEDLSKLWQKIIFGSTRKIERGMEGHFKFGTELDVEKAVAEWPNIENGKFEETRIFKKMTQKEVLIRKPELIRVRLAGDMSGSMDKEKIHILQQCFVLLLSSLQEFNTYLNFERTRTKSKLEVDTEAWIFGDSAKKVKKLRSESGYGDDQVEIVKIFENLQNTIGNTYDDKVLREIANSFSKDDLNKIKQGKVMEILFEVTDGGSSSKDDAKSAVDKLSDLGVIARAFQIGGVSDEEKKIFNQVWNDGREEGFGEIIGEKIENIIPAITEVLKKYLNNVSL